MSGLLYDEFGNYIGPDVDEDESESFTSSSDEESVEKEESAMAPKNADGALAVLPEVVGNVEDVMMVEEEDAQPITVPIIEPERKDEFNLHAPVDLGYDYRYLEAVRSIPSLCRSVAIMGDLHHGKTALCDLLVGVDDVELNKQTLLEDAEKENKHVASKHDPKRSTLRSRKATAHTKEVRFTDNRLDEQERGISLKSCPLTLLCPNLFGKNYVLNVIDTPGHVNFIDEVSAGLRLSDSAVLCVDVLIGPRIGLRKQLEVAAREGLSKLILFVSCIDRLILEVRLPPQDAYFKIRHTISEINEMVYDIWTSLGLDPPPIFDPAVGNVVFGSARYACIFSLASFAQLHVEKKIEALQRTSSFTNSHLQQLPFDVDKFAQLLWGDFWFNPGTRKFQRSKPEVVLEDDDDEDNDIQRTFVEFVLKPLYKLFAHVVGEEKPTLKPTLEELGIQLDDALFSLDTPTLLKLVCSYLFPGTRPLIQAIVEHVPSSEANARRKVFCTYSGNLESDIAKDLMLMKADAQRCVVHTTKNYHRPNELNTFDAFGRVFCGTLRKGDKVKVFGERYSLDDDEDVAFRTVESLWIYEGRFRIQVDSAPAGSWVLIGGVGDVVAKTATITTMPDTENDEMEIFRPLYFPCRNVVRVACEPQASSDLPKMIDGLRQVCRSYPSIETVVEDSGAHVIICAGELAADCALHDLRRLYGNLEIRCADPVPIVCETVVGKSTAQHTISTPNKKNNFTMGCEPLEEELAKHISTGLISDQSDPNDIRSALKDQYGWDTLAAHSLWAFASDGIPSALLNDILPSRTNTRRKDANIVKEFIVHGFQWVTREGPLIEEEVRNVKFKLLDAEIAVKEPIHRGSGQIIPTVRRAAYAALLTATPRLMEPMLSCQITCPADCVNAVQEVLSRRRGHLFSNTPIPATPLEILMAFVPAIDSFGLETDIRTHTSGQAFIESLFDHWSTLPGDPLDTSIVLRPLEPSPAPHLAREFLLKTRRRKGLAEDVNLSRFTDF